MDEIAGEEEIVGGALPDRGLVPRDPVRLGLGLEEPNGLSHAPEREERAPRAADRLQPPGTPAVGPEDRRSQRLARGVEVDDRSTLRRECHAPHGVPRYGRLAPELLAALSDGAPEVVRILLGPADFRRVV